MTQNVVTQHHIRKLHNKVNDTVTLYEQADARLDKFET